MYVVAGVTGHTGKVVAETLLARGEKVRAIVRDAKQGEAWKQKGAEVVVAQLNDTAAMARALTGAEGAYLLVPPRYDADDMLAVQRPLVDALAEAVRRSGVPHVVLLSSLGGELSDDTGPIRGLHYAERTLSAATRNITLLRAGYFIENFATVLPATQAGVLPTFLTPDRALPMAATADIGVATADLFPRVSLVGLIGFASNRLTDLGTRDSPQYSLGAGLTWPLLDFGRVRSRIAASEARTQQSLASYEQTVAIALEETEGALTQFTRNAQQAERLASAARNAEEATRLSRLRFDAGAVDLLVVLDAQRQSLAARDALVQSQVGQATALVAIYRALGGGWADVPPAALAQR